MSDPLPRAGAERDRPTVVTEYATLLRVVVLVGVPVGVLAIGLGSRLAMLVLRLTSPPDVVGVTSDDGFTIGRVTMGGTYNLVNLGVAVGLVGALACLVVSPWLIGPPWFRAATVGLTAGALVGAMVIHPDGVDFTRLQPVWLSVAVFVALPTLVAALLLVLVDRVVELGPPPPGRRWAWPLALLVPAPLGVAAAAVPVLLGGAVLVLLGRTVLPALHRSRSATVAVRATFLLVPAVAGLGLVEDLAALS